MKGLYKRGESESQITQSLADTIGRNLVVHVLLGQLDATDQKRVFVAPCECIVKDADLTSETALAIDGTNYRSFQLNNVTQSNDLLASAKTTFTGGTAITADTPYSLKPDQNNKLAAGDVIELVQTKTASPTALEECSVTLQISFDADDEA